MVILSVGKHVEKKKEKEKQKNIKRSGEPSALDSRRIFDIAIIPPCCVTFSQGRFRPRI